jgi:hypothetical protein
MTDTPQILRGSREIARFLRRSKNEVLRLIREEGLPVSRECNSYITSVSLLLEWQEGRCCKTGGGRGA